MKYPICGIDIAKDKHDLAVLSEDEKFKTWTIDADERLAELPEPGRCSHRQLNALAGVAPYNDDSAKRQGQRHIKGDRFELRRALYMAAQTGYRHNLVLKSLYDRLREKGRPHKAALVACINKMLKILNTMVKINTPYDRNNAVD